MVKVMIVDDHQVLIDGMKALFEQHPYVNICAEALNGETAIRNAENEDIEVILLDINLPDKSGFEICEIIKKTKPDLKIIALTMHKEAGYITKMSKTGVDGYLLKNTSKDEIIEAIEKVMAGEKYFSKEVTDSLIAGMHKSRKPKSSDFIQKLTRREKEILKLIVEENTTDEIAKLLFIGNTTVISHRKSLLRKLNAKNTAGLVRAAFEFGLLEES